MKKKFELLKNNLNLSLDYDRRNLSKKHTEDSSSFFIETNTKEGDFYSFYKKYKWLEKAYTASLVMLLNILSLTCILMILKYYNLSLMGLLVSIGFYIENFKHLYQLLLSVKLRYRFFIFLGSVITLLIFNQEIYSIFTHYVPV